MIDRTTIQRIMDAADIVDVVQEFVTLRRSGANFKGLCPFHNEKTPSFMVSPAKQLCKCFSCGKGGNVVHFIMEHEQMTYPEALRFLAKKYGIEIEEKELTPEQRAAETERESMMVVNEWAKNYFSDILWNHADGRAIGMAYFRQRGFRDDIIKKFQLGFCLSGRDEMARAALSKGYKREFLLKTGLCYEVNNGGLADRYHGRVIFPVHTVSGRIVAFGGRVLETGPKVAKYVNSPESEIYHKSNELYGLYLAKHAIVKEGRCFLVEGYTDVISMHQSGIENVVASSGTSLTEGQIRLIHRFTENITVLYDGDSAGIKASLRGIDMLLAEGLNIKVLLLPDGDDPDSFARKNNAEQYKAYIDSHQVDFIKFKTDLLLQDCGDDPIKKANLIKDIVSSISVIPNAIVRQMYARQCASSLMVDEALVVSEVAKDKRRNEKDNKPQAVPSAPGTSEEPQSEPSPTDGQATANEETGVPGAEPIATIREHEEERLLTQLIVRYGEKKVFNANSNVQTTVIEYINEDLTGDGLNFQVPIYKNILDEAVAHIHDEGFIAEKFFQIHADPQISLVATQLLSDRYQLSAYHSKHQKIKQDEERLNELVPRLLNDFKYSIIAEELKKILTQLHSPEMAQYSEKTEELMKQYMQWKEVEKQLAQNLGDRVISNL